MQNWRQYSTTTHVQWILQLHARFLETASETLTVGIWYRVQFFSQHLECSCPLPTWFKSQLLWFWCSFLFICTLQRQNIIIQRFGFLQKYMRDTGVPNAWIQSRPVLDALEFRKWKKHMEELFSSPFLSLYIYINTRECFCLFLCFKLYYWGQ